MIVKQTQAIAIWITLAMALSINALPAQNEVIYKRDVQPVWSGHPVGFALLTHKNWQFVAYYRQYDNAGTIEHRLSFAQRRVRDSDWTFHHTTQTTPWDSHNYMTMTVDDDDYIHVSGNMHVDPLRYYRSAEPLDITTIDVSQSTPMVGTGESEVTYPQFFRDPSGRLIYTYRDGSSGDGDNIYNVYDHGTQTWSRLLATSLIDGEGTRNAYPWGPILGPDGYMHLVWVWRENPDASQNHTVSYMKSPDLENWFAADGSSLTLPITYGNTAVVVDPVPVEQGLINGSTKIGFDSQDRAVVSYHKYESYVDPTAATQIYNARFESGAWQIRQTSNWDYRWEFSGGGTIGFEISVNPVELNEQGELTQRIGNAVEGSFLWTLDESDFSILASEAPPRTVPREVSERKHIFPGVAEDGGYVHTPETAAGQGEVTIPFKLESAGTYTLWARVRGLEGNLALTDSVIVQINNNSEIEWHNLAQSAWGWRKVTSGPTRVPVSFNLGAGTHTLRFKTREPGAEVDMAIFTTDPDFQPIAPPATASGGEYVGSRYEDEDTGSVSWSVNVPAAGDYVLWARTRATAGVIGNTDSYFVSINGGAEDYYSIPPYAAWTWGQVKNGSTVQSYTLSAGNHTVRFRTREAGASVDVLALAPVGDEQAPTVVWEAEEAPTLDAPVALYSEAPDPAATGYLQAENGAITAPMRRMLEAVSGNEMTVRTARDLNGIDHPDNRYLLRWETLGPNRDYPRPEPWPEPTMLELYYVGTAPEEAGTDPDTLDRYQ